MALGVEANTFIMQNYTRLFCIPIFSATLALEPHSLRISPARQPYNQMDGLLPLRSQPACCPLGRFFLTCFFLRAFLPTFYCELFTRELFTCELSSFTRLFSSLRSLYLRIMLDGRYGCAVMFCTGSLLSLLTVLLVLYRRSLTALYRFLTALS